MYFKYDSYLDKRQKLIIAVINTFQGRWKETICDNQSRIKPYSFVNTFKTIILIKYLYVQ